MFMGLEGVFGHDRGMKIATLPVAAAFSLACLASSAGAETLAASPWVDFREASVRLLVEPARDAAGPMRGALEIRLSHGYKTYWRHAGDTGVPPAFDFSRSTGLGAVAVSFPLPGTFDDGAGGTAFGYVESAILPFEAERKPGEMRLHLKLDFAVCGSMCIPLSGEMTLDPARAVPVEPATRMALEKARARVPQRLTGDEAMRQVQVMPMRGGEKPRWRIAILPGKEPDALRLFAEGKMFLSATRETIAPQHVQFVIEADPPRGDAPGHGTARLTFGDHEMAREVIVDLDAGRVLP